MPAVEVVQEQEQEQEQEKVEWIKDVAAVKFDDGKPQLSLIPVEALNGMAHVLAYGAEKYGRDNWRAGMDWTRLIDAAMRHIAAFNDGEDNDPETGLSHLSHAMCGLSFLVDYLKTHPELDNRA